MSSAWARSALFWRENPPCSYVSAAPPLAAPRATGSKKTAAAPKRKASASASSASSSTAVPADSDDLGIACPSDDEQPQPVGYDTDAAGISSSDGDDDDEEEAEEAEEEVGGGGGAKAAPNGKGKGKEKAKKKTLSKAEKGAEKDKLWPDLKEAEKLPDALKKEEFTGPELGGPSAKCTRKAGDHPSLYMQDLGYDDEMFRTLADNSNMYAAGLGAGTSDLYHDFEPFTPSEIMKGLSVLVRNGLAPVPQIALNFSNPNSTFVYGDERMRQLFLCLSSGAKMGS